MQIYIFISKSQRKETKTLRFYEKRLQLFLGIGIYKGLFRNKAGLLDGGWQICHPPSARIKSTLYLSYITCHSLVIGSALLKYASLIIDAPKKRFVFLPHQGQQEITVGNKDVNSLSFIPTEKGDPNGVMTAIVREGSIAYQKGVRTGDYLLEVDGIPITDFCTFLRMEFDDKETPMKFRSPDGTEKQVTLKRVP